MSIDTSGKWWRGNNIEDIKDYLIAYSESAYPVQKVAISKCNKCGCEEFLVEFDWDEGVSRVICKSCETIKYLADSQENWNDIKPRKYKCVECKSTHANVGIGYAYRENGDIKWVYIGVRCSKCGILGSVTDWKIDFSPTKEIEENI
jgi:hypothetical protein